MRLGSGLGLGIGGTRLWTPFALGSSLVAAYIFDAANVTLDGSNNISQVNDLTTGAKHLTQATAGSRPGYSASDAAYGNKGVMNLTGGPGKWVFNNTFAQANPLSFVIVGQYSTASTNNVIMVMSDTTGPQLVSDSTQKIAIFPIGVHSTIGTNSPHAIYCESTGNASDKLSVDAISGAGVTGNTGATAATEISLGAYGAGSFGMTTAKIRSLFVFNRKLTAGEQVLMASYISRDTGLTIT
jgi:hypothetical protein